MSVEQDQLKIIVTSLEDKKAEDIKIIEISEISSMASYFVIASGYNSNQVQAMADEVEHNLKSVTDYSHKIEGYRKANWILLDYGDIIIHIFDRDSRQFYNLEKLWMDGKEISIETL